MDRVELIKTIVENQRVVNRFMHQEDPEMWMESNLTVAQVRCMFFIAGHTDVNFRMLAEVLKVTPSNVTGIIDRLADQELVVREENPQDRRMQMLKLTTKGSQLISNVRTKRINQMHQLLNQMSEDQLNSVGKGYSLLAEQIKNAQDA
jgi:DNA-binding MarR family transcriptional regulator